MVTCIDCGCPKLQDEMNTRLQVCWDCIHDVFLVVHHKGIPNPRHHKWFGKYREKSA